MTIALDYANYYEQQRRRLSFRYVGVLAVWLGLFLVRPRLALDIYRSKVTPCARGSVRP